MTSTGAKRRASPPVSEVLESEDVREILREGFFAPPASLARLASPPAAAAPAATPAPAPAPAPAPEEPAEPAPSNGSAARNRSLTTATRARKSAKKPAAKERPDHYKVICISLYNDDLALLDRVVKDLKKRGFTKANRSAVLRAAMQQFDPTKVSRGL
jgi:hypothetical protein